MTAQELIDSVVAGEYKERAHVRGIIDDSHWWHIHRDEDLPEDHRVIVYVRI